MVSCGYHRQRGREVAGAGQVVGAAVGVPQRFDLLLEPGWGWLAGEQAGVGTQQEPVLADERAPVAVGREPLRWAAKAPRGPAEAG